MAEPRRIPGWVFLLVIALCVAAAAMIIVLGKNR